MHATTIFLAILGLAAKSLAAPIPAANKTTGVEKRFEGGWCGLHLRGERHDANVKAFVKVFDSRQSQLQDESVFESHNRGTIVGAVPAGTGGLPLELRMNIFHGDGAVATFEYGDQHWDSGAAGTQNDHCKVGKYDGFRNDIFMGDQYSVDLDCGFSC
ncbi:hypothetical protein PG997_013547 [Apiospora hydei]|uniref:Uncharacterized protein n=1 Tax=Apiospora hydei TaxID=1337664 RepID=A0ABR1V958_9PEZI